MQYRRLGDSGLCLSALSLDAAAAGSSRGSLRNLVAMAWDRGINLFDSAGADGDGTAEQVLGDVIADLRLPRDGFAVASRVRPGVPGTPRPMQRGLSRKRVRDGCDAALRRLRVDYIDLFSCPQPEPDQPLAETVAAMDALIGQGKVLYWGTSGWPATRILEARAIARVQGLRPPTMERPRYGVLERRWVEQEHALLCTDGALGLTVCATAGGVDTRLAAIAAELGVPAGALDVAWCLRNRSVSSVLVGAVDTGALETSLAALLLYDRLGPDAWQRVDAVSERDMP
ncbi:MAG TPA: aldo/keto reductase [Luteimonas sp.]|nr:aldo/keto reductase [Luteimonas sp.]